MSAINTHARRLIDVVHDKAEELREMTPAEGWVFRKRRRDMQAWPLEVRCRWEPLRSPQTERLFSLKVNDD